MKNIIILLSTYNGEKYLKAQVDSLLSQTHKHIQIFARDDGSTDNTLEILRSSDIDTIPSTANLGAMASFEALLSYAIANTSGEYFMFCDQDDVWRADKVEKTISKMRQMEDRYADTPLLVHTDLEVVDESLKTTNNSFMSSCNIDARYNKLNNLLLQNTITGCTTMINKKLAKLSLPMPSEAIIHDWWLGLVATVFGEIGYIAEPTIRYRQHSDNNIGAKRFDIVYIIQHILKSDLLSKNTTAAKAFLDRYRDKLDDDTIDMLEDFSTIQTKSFWQKRKTLFKHKLLKQGFVRNIGLVLKI